MIAVAFQSFRKSITMITVSRAPSSSSLITSRTELRIRTELSRTICNCVPAGRSACNLPITVFTPSATATVLAPDTLMRSMPIVRRASTRASERSSSVASSTRATSESRTVSPARVVMITLSNWCGSTMRPVTRTSCSPAPRSTRPAGTSMFCRCNAAEICGTVTPSASMRAGWRYTRTSRLSPPESRTSPTPGTDSSRRRIVSSANAVSRTSGTFGFESASEMIGMALRSSFCTTGGSTPTGKSRRMPSIFERRSCAATSTGRVSSNSTVTCETPSSETDVIFFTCSTGLNASSRRRVTSRSIVSALAPGYVVCTVTMGMSTAGNWSIGRRR